MKRLLLALLFVLWAIPASAQGSGTPVANPCARPALTQIPPNTPFTVCAEHDGFLTESYCVAAVNLQEIPVSSDTLPSEPGHADPVVACSDVSAAFLAPDAVHIRVANGLPAGTYALTVRAVGFSGTSQSAAIGLTVVGDAPPPTPTPDPTPTPTPPPTCQPGTVCAPAPGPTPTPTPAPLPAPTNVRTVAAAVLSSAPPRAGFPIRLPFWVQWDPVVGAAAYCVDMAWSSGEQFITKAPVMSLDYPLPLGMPGHQYAFTVRASSVVPPASNACDGNPVTIPVER